MEAPVWRPSTERVRQANLTAFRKAVEKEWNLKFADYPALHRWSVEKPEQFWASLWSFCGIKASRKWDQVIVEGDRMPGAKWFVGARLNFAENLLQSRDDTPAMIFHSETGLRRSVSHADLYDQVARLARSLKELGVKPHDRVAGFLPNCPETVIALLAASSLGAVWSSCSPDFGLKGLLDRFGQIEPKILFAVDGYTYNGKPIDCGDRIRGIAQRIPSLEKIVIIPYLNSRPSLEGIPSAAVWSNLIAEAGGDIRFEQLPFDHPVYILYSSGTTGVPKCIIHGAGGALLQHHKEHRLHADVKPGDRMFYFTTCGWMMWNWLVSGLASGATLILYDGSPFHPDAKALWNLAEQERISVFGTSASYLSAIEKSGIEPRRTHDLSGLKAIISTGSPLAPRSFDYVYQKVKQDVHLASISGGTDLVASFGGGNPTGPVYRGELQARPLGMKVEVYDDQGRPTRGQKGELVCEAPFPTVPLGFWNDPDGRNLRAAYFHHFPGVWRHGDYAEITEHDGLIIYGRSDAVLNPHGVRIGTAEIYRQVEGLDAVLESIAAGQEWENDIRIILFVRLRDGLILDESLAGKIRERIRRNTTPRHVPAKIIQVTDIPRTISGKIVELAVREVIHDRPVKNADALANPEALELFKNLPELES